MSQTRHPAAAIFADVTEATTGVACAVAPASYVQEKLWLVEQVQRDNLLSNVSAVVRFNSRSSIESLERSFATIVQRHEVLRTHFVRQQGQLMQVIRPEVNLFWQTADLQHIGDGAQRLRQLHKRLAACEKLPFQLNTGPLIRCYVYTLGPAEHVLQFVAHQSVFDGGSHSVLMSELSTLHRSFETGSSPDTLPPLRIQYKDFARAQRDRLQGEGMARLRTYWSRQLAGLPSRLELPTDRPRPAVPIQRHERVTGLLPATLVAEIQSIAEQLGATAFMTFLAAFKVLLFRYSGTTDIAVATPVAGRDAPGLETLIGPVVNTVVIRCRIEPDSPFVELLEQVKGTVLAAYEHQDMPFEQLMELLQPECTASHAPSIQVMFALQGLQGLQAGETDPGGETGCGLMQTVSLESRTVTAGFDLSLEIAGYPDGVRCSLDYATDLFDHETIARMLKHFEVLLAGIVRDARQTVARLPLLTPEEHQQLLVTWNATAVASSPAGCIHHWFEPRVSERPEAVAVTYEGESITYAQLNERSNRLAHYLLERHAGPGSRIALCIERSIEMVVAVLAILKSGAAYVPVDPKFPQRRVEFMLADSGASVMLTQKSLRQGRLQGLTIPMFCLDADSAELAQFSPTNVRSAVAGHHCAYVIYTSGSTGTPKGVMVTHDSVMNTLGVLEARYPLGEADSYLLKTNYVFDISVTELFGWFIGRGRLVILPPGLEGSPEVLADYVVRHRITHINFSPSLLQGFLLEVRRDPRFRDRAALKYVMSGGEALPKHLVKEAIEVLWPAALENLYGPTETAVYCMSYSCTAPIESQNTPIGRPFPNMQVYVLDEHLQPVPVGIPGELCVAGRGLARGYLNRPDLTAEKFIPHPFASDTKLYKTGDRVRWLPQGELEYLGRADYQVKVRGMRVELGEIEARLLESGWVRAAVVSLQATAGGERLIGYVVPGAEQAARMGLSGRGVTSATARDEFIADLRGALQQSLPAYMVPAFYVTLSQFPLNHAGKVDRNALTALPVESGARHAPYVAARTEPEKTLCSIWQDVLRLDKVGIRDNFFASGGDSILSIQVAFKARAQGLYLGARQLFQHQTVEELAAHARLIAPSQSEEGCAGEMVLLPIHRQLLEHDAAAVRHCCQYRLLRVPAGFTLEFLRKAVGALHRQHDALRLRFGKTTGGWQARFAEFQEGTEFPEALLDTAIRYEPLVCATEDDPRRALGEWIDAAGESLDMENGPLLVAAVRTTSQLTDCRLLLMLHQLVADEVSWRVILEDLALAFAQWHSGQPINLPPKTHSYQKWGAALADPARVEAWRRERDYWSANLSRAVEPLPVGRANPRDSWQSTTQVETLRWSKEETTSLLSRCHGAYRTHTDELLLAGLLLAFYRGTGRRAMRITSSGNGREADLGGPREEWDLSRTVGCFTCYYTLTLSLPDIEDDTVKGGERFHGELIRTVKEQYRGTPNQGLGYGVLRYLMQDNSLDTVPGGAPVEIVFKGLGRLDCRTGIADTFPLVRESCGSTHERGRRQNHVLSFSGSVEEGCLFVEIDYNSQQLETETIQCVARMYPAALREIITHCQRPGVGGFTPSDFPLVHLQPNDIEHWHALYPRLENIYPITGLQLGLLFHSRLEGSGATYSNQMWVTLSGEFNAAAFKQAWSVVVSRHAILRTAFVGMEREQPLQLVVNDATPIWQELDHLDIRCTDSDASFDRCRLYEKNQPFNFSRPCLLRFLLIHTAESQYRFVWTYHHSILDGWSGALLWNEVLSAYHALAQGSVPRLPPVIPYSDYIQWLQRQDTSAAESYWRKELVGIERAPTLTIEQEGLQAQGAEYSPVCSELTEEETSELQQAARSAQVTLATVLQAAWACLLHLYCADAKVTFGVTVSGRAIDLPGVEAIAGLFINTVPARVVIDATQRIADWLRSIQQAQVEREAHGFMALLDVQRCSGMRAGNALFDSVLVVENHPLSIARTAAALIPVDYGNDARTHYGLALLVMPGERLSMSLHFEPTRFDRADVSSMAARLKSILQRFSAASLGEAVGSLYADRHVAAPVSGALRQGELRLGRYLVPQLIENQARQFPGKVAVLCNEAVYTYEALNRLANRMANGLLDRFPSLKADSLIGVLLPRSDKLLVTLLAIWKTGAAYIPLDPALPSARIQQMLQNANALLVIADRESLARHPCDKWGIPVTTWDGIGQDSDTSEADPDINISGHDLCYVIYTSGSTGIPKGAMVEHLGMLNNIANKVIDLQITDSSRVAQTASQSFDICVWQMFIALTQGATTVIYDDRIINDIGRFMQCLHDDCITVVEMVPSYLVLVTEYLAEHPRERLPPCLRFLVLTGETADASFIKHWWRYFPDTKVVNAYGPTEASDDITHHILSHDDDIVNPIPVGRPLANFDIYIVDDSLRPVPVGEKGEIVVTGVGVGRGYVNLAGATAKAFVDSPFPDKYKGRLYRTGDVGQLRADGVLLFHGRKDRQVKVRGFRIELDEVEIKLLEIESVRQAVVLDITVPGAGMSLCAFVVPYGVADKEALLDQLGEKLPAYMVPTEWRFLEELPLLANGKVDRRALRDLRGAAVSSTAYRAPRSELEIRLAAIWREVLGVEQIGTDADFFELGGDSFKAIRIAAKYGSALEVTDIYNSGTIGALAASLEQQGQARSRRIVALAEAGAATRVAVLGISNSAGDPVSFLEMGRELAALGGEIALYAVKLPRRPVDDATAMSLEIERLTEEICTVVAREIQVPLIIFGQCNGSALAVSVAQRLQKNLTPPRAVCIGGALLRTFETPVDDRNDREIIESLQSMGASLPQQPDELAFFLNDFRYDCELADCCYNSLVAQMNAGSAIRIDAPIYCIAGSDDPLVAGYAQKFRDWARLSDQVSLIEFTGHGHYLLRDCPRDLAVSIRDIWRGLE